MATVLPQQIIDLLLLGAPGRQRQLQDLPILGDVWSELAAAPEPPPDLLIIPCWNHAAAKVAALLQDSGESQNEDGDRSVAFLEGMVVATLTLHDLLVQVLPFTLWWESIEQQWPEKERARELPLEQWIADELRNLLPVGQVELLGPQGTKKARTAPHSPGQQIARLATLIGVFESARMEVKAELDGRELDLDDARGDPALMFARVVEHLGADRIIRAGASTIREIFKNYSKERASKAKDDLQGAIFHVTMNRKAELAVRESVSAIKADATRSLFSIGCSKIGWAVLDSGIDYEHPAFLDHRRAETGGPKRKQPGKLPPHRIRAAFDFTRIRAILGVKEKELAELSKEIAGRTGISEKDARARLEEVIAARDARSPVDWHSVEPLVRLDVTRPPKEPPKNPHGTHVAGIIGADWRKKDRSGATITHLQGVCPDIALYDFRVLGSKLGDSEFAVSAALQFIRYYNERGGHQAINGVNMSVAIRHNVRNYACGQTPVCAQAEALVSSGVVVVAAAGNRGYLQYQLADQSIYEGYAASSITDPGNADGVITVGATHRSWPHTYGVSFFSSRGPTGDGRLKPDLLAPGEKITSCVPGNREDAMDGTSMAAPHVSGAAALLMARHEELKGRPQRIKEILCSTATDLSRERHFQGHGMVDVLRAIQSI